MIWISRWCVAALVLAAGTLAGSQSPIWIGLVRDDGYLIPIASVPPELFDPTVPVPSADGEPFPPPPRGWPFKDLAWTMTYGHGPKSVEIRTVEQVKARMPYCSDRLLWRTTLKRPPAIPWKVPVRKLGMAISGATLEFPDDVTNQPDPPSRRVAQRIVSLFLTKEKARLANEKGDYAVSAAPGSPPVRIRQLMRHAIGGVSVYHFVATKALTLPGGGVDPNAGLVTGWMAESASGLRDYEVIYKVNDDVYKENESAVVRGIVRHGPKALWLLEWHGWESEFYTLHDWPSGVRRLTADAYDCS